MGLPGLESQSGEGVCRDFMIRLDPKSEGYLAIAAEFPGARQSASSRSIQEVVRLGRRGGRAAPNSFCLGFVGFVNQACHVSR